MTGSALIFPGAFARRVVAVRLVALRRRRLAEAIVPRAVATPFPPPAAAEQTPGPAGPSAAVVIVSRWSSPAPRERGEELTPTHDMAREASIPEALPGAGARCEQDAQIQEECRRRFCQLAAIFSAF